MGYTAAAAAGDNDDDDYELMITLCYNYSIWQCQSFCEHGKEPLGFATVNLLII
jgi:hypothetical protein